MTPYNCDEVLEAAEDEMCGLSNKGFCIHCGCEHDGCEPDARNYSCDNCGQHQVYGAAEIIVMNFPSV